MAKDLMHVEIIATPDYEQIKKHFLDELTLASIGSRSSLSYIKHLLPSKPILTSGIVQGIVIGGTNYIISTVKIKASGEQIILKHERGILPTFDSLDTLKMFLQEHLDEKADAVGANFGFPLEPVLGSFGELDGKLIRGTKEHRFTGLSSPLGTIVKDIFKTKFHKTVRVSVANDTVCLVLAGNGDENGSLIAGTGVNMGLKVSEANKPYIVNLEAGNFAQFSPSDILKKIDDLSENPRGQLFEKTISGKYLALYFNEKAKDLGLTITPLTTSQALSALSHSHDGKAGDLARAILERSAFLLAASLAAIYEFNGKPKKFILIGEGSMLWKGWHYQENIQKQLTKLGVPEGAIEIRHVQDSSIKGALKLSSNNPPDARF